MFFMLFYCVMFCYVVYCTHCIFTRDVLYHIVVLFAFIVWCYDLLCCIVFYLLLMCCVVGMHL